MSLALYKVGYRAEQKAKKILEGQGFLVMRSAKSGGPFDLMAVSGFQFILVQVKVCPFGKIPMFKILKAELARIKVPANCKKELWVWEKRSGFHHFNI